MNKLLRTLAISLAAAVLVPGAVIAQTLGFTTLPVGAINNIQAQVIAKVVQGKTGMQVRVIPVSGTTATLAAVQNREAEFSISNIDNVADAMRSEGVFSTLPKMDNQRLAFKLISFPIGIMVRNDGPIKKIEDLKGKRFGSGFQGFPNMIPLSNGVLAAGGLSLDDTVGVPVSGLIPAADDFKAGKTDGTTIALEAPKVKEVHAAIPGGVRFLSMSDTPQALAAVQKVKPEYGIMRIEPGPRFAGVTEPINVLRIDLMITTGGHVADDIVYRFVKAVAENKDEMVKGHPIMNGFFPERMAQQYDTVKYHPGAIKYYKERGIWAGS